MAIVKTDVPLTAGSCEETILSLVRAYPFLRTEVLTATVFGRKIRTLVIGSVEANRRRTQHEHRCKTKQQKQHRDDQQICRLLPFVAAGQRIYGLDLHSAVPLSQMPARGEV